MSTQTTWPEGVIARYLTVAGVVAPNATVDVETLTTVGGDAYSTRGTCAGCGAVDYFDYSLYRAAREWESQSDARAWAQAHAERCRALPRPQGGGW
ncbi:hypothetical protein [Streptomyces albus]|uniref:hypothetical protein n=1 Tax=Streptomyces albus TaxID=1888 RepID=UPI0033F2CEDB